VGGHLIEHGAPALARDLPARLSVRLSYVCSRSAVQQPLIAINDIAHSQLRKRYAVLSVGQVVESLETSYFMENKGPRQSINQSISQYTF